MVTLAPWNVAARECPAYSERVPLAFAGVFDGSYELDDFAPGQRLEVVQRGPFAYVSGEGRVLGCLPPRWRSRYRDLAQRGLTPSIRFAFAERVASDRVSIVIDVQAAAPLRS